MRTIITCFVVGSVVAIWSCGGTSSTTDGGAEGGGACSPSCTEGQLCCNGACVDSDNDPKNCGSCGNACSGATPYCDRTCKALPACTKEGGSCGAGSTCCGPTCCTTGQICCKAEGPVGGEPVCFTPTASQPTCSPDCAPLCKSDRATKQDVKPVDDQQVLERVAEMPIGTWAYKDDPSTRHIGPMAQDFHDAFGLGASDRSYSPIDAHGVAFSSIKALNARIHSLEEENRALERRLRALESKR